MTFWTSTKRIIRSGFIGFLRNGFVSFSTIFIMIITLLVVGSTIFIGAALESALVQIKDKVDINVYFLVDAPEERILDLKTKVEVLPEVASVEYVTREEALARFRERHKNDQLTLQALEELGDNPLGASLAVRAKETSQYEGIAKFLEEDTALTTGDGAIVEKVNFFQNKPVIDKLTEIVNASEKFGFVIIIVLAVASVLIAFNTIRLGIYTSREEISVMQLVGAENAYVRGPFVVEGVLYGLISGFATLIILYPLTLWLGPVSEQFFGTFNVFTYYLENFGIILLIILGTGIILGSVSSYLAVRRYLHSGL